MSTNNKPDRRAEKAGVWWDDNLSGYALEEGTSLGDVVNENQDVQQYLYSLGYEWDSDDMRFYHSSEKEIFVQTPQYEGQETNYWPYVAAVRDRADCGNCLRRASCRGPAGLIAEPDGSALKWVEFCPPSFEEEVE